LRVTTPVHRPPRIRIERIWPELDGGLHPVKRAVGDTAEVWATIVRDGHEVMGAAVRYRPPGARRWREVPMRPIPQDPDRWHGSFTPDKLGRWQFGVIAWVDRVASWKHELERKVTAGQSDLTGELREGAALLGVDSLTVEEGLAATPGDRSEQTVSDGALEITADAERATFGSWYELFPRS
jgi:starch synthase (maltosyl-transferring)